MANDEEDVLHDGSPLLSRTSSTSSSQSTPMATSSIIIAAKQNNDNEDSKEEDDTAINGEDSLGMTITDVHIEDMEEPPLITMFKEEPASLTAAEELAEEGDATIILEHAEGTFPPFTASFSSRTSSSSAASPLSTHESTLNLAASTSTLSPDSLVLLAARLRQERDEAVSRLAFSSLEHDITVRTLEAELQELGSGRDALKQDLAQMVNKLMEGEKMQSALEEVTDTLCQSESSYRQVKGRLETVNAELQELRQRLADSEETLNKAHDSDTVSPVKLPVPPLVTSCTCREGLEELRRENANLEEQLDRTVNEHHGATNLVLSLQAALDARDEDLLLAKKSLQDERHRSLSLRQELEEAKHRIETLNAVMKDNKAARATEIKEHQSETTTLQDALQYVQLQLQGATNRTLLLQNQLDEQFEARGAHARELKAMQSEVTNLAEVIAQQKSDACIMRANSESLLADRNALQKALESFVLVHLQLQEDFRKTRNRGIRQADSISTSHHSSNHVNDATLSNMIVALAETANDLSDLRKRERDLELQTTTLTAKLESLQRDQVVSNVQLVAARVKEENLSYLEKAKASLQVETERLQEDLLHARQELTEAAIRATSLDIHSAQLADRLSAKEVDLASARTEIERQAAQIASLQEDLSQTRDSLRVAEEEGRNLVADFNMLSEELENRQSEDETRTAMSETTRRQLAEATAREEQLQSKCAQDEAELSLLRDKLETLEADLQQMQISVEETDDKYLDSLKTIKKQTVLLDKLKIRNEALSRANALLNQAMPSATRSPLAPLPSSAKKRGLPKDFVAPDPGPTGVMVAPNSVARHQHPNTPASPLAENIAAAATSRRQERPQEAPAASTRGHVASQISTDERLLQAKPTKAHASQAIVKDKSSAASVPQKTARAPLAPVIGQKRTSASIDTAQMDRKSGSVMASSKSAFKPTPALNPRPLPKSGVSSDTRNLLAALHALKQPSRQ